MATVKQVKKALGAKTEWRPPIPIEDRLSLGCDVINLSVSGEATWGLAKGKYLYFVGDSSSGKTAFVMTVLAEAAKNTAFDKYDFVYDAPEFGNDFDWPKFFGNKVTDRIVPPRGTRARPRYSRTVQEFYHNLHRRLKSGKPCIYIEDSMDGLLDVGDEEKFEKEIEASEQGKEIAGSYGVGKAKTNSSNIKRAVSMLPETGSILIIISQTRDKIGPFPGRTRAGGRALKFYAHVELWTSVKADLKRTVLKKEREYGKMILVDVQKNRVNGRDCKVEVPFLWDFGVDNTGASVNFLITEGYWTEKKGTVKAADFDFVGRREDLIRKIETTKGWDAKLRNLLGFWWRKIAQATKVERKRRYE